MNRKNKVKAKRKNKGLKIGLLVVLGIILFIVGFGYSYVHNLLNSTNKNIISTANEDLGIKGEDSIVETTSEDSRYYYTNVTGVTNIALFGVDAEIGKNGRSDTIMIVTVDKNTKKIKLTSIVRDSYVDIPDRGMDKINHAYAFGGAQLALKTINTNFHLDIRSYATVNFTTLPKIIDTIGGVKITVTNAEATQIAGLSSGGTYNLTGAQALDYSRIRHIDSDFARSGRQRTVIEAIINKMLNSSVTSYPSILSKVLPMITTNMSSNDILGLATTVVTSGIRTIEQNRFPQDTQASGQTIKGVYYYVFKKEPTLDAMGRYIYLDEATN
ncbi:MAG: LCP family protein [Clostridiaceae bacterium]